MSALKNKLKRGNKMPDVKPKNEKLIVAKIIKLSNGEEIACLFPEINLPDKSPLMRIENPLLVKYVPRYDELGIADYIALVKWVGFTNDNVVSIPKDKILTICNATPDFTKRYLKILKNSDKWEQRLPDYLNRNMSKKELESGADEFEDTLNKLKQYLPAGGKRTLH
tara:strand:+ start:912 stop:1412 length:501 start_codon:yes stop_codon:yes gene_type:complete